VTLASELIGSFLNINLQALQYPMPLVFLV